MTWINRLKIAVIQEDIETATELVKTAPKFQNIQEAKEAKSLIEAAINIAIREKEKTLEAMNKIKQTKKFLNQ
jgi:outer membrane PBP1 activator LpoA protein